MITLEGYLHSAQMTARFRAKRQIFGLRRSPEEREFNNRVKPLSNAFKTYLLDQAREKGVTEAQVYFVGCGGDGAFEMWAMQEAAMETGITIHAAGIDPHQIPTSIKSAKKLIEAGLLNPEILGNPTAPEKPIDEKVKHAFRKTGGEKPFEGLDKAKPLFIIIRHPQMNPWGYDYSKVFQNCKAYIDDFNARNIYAKLLITSGLDTEFSRVITHPVFKGQSIQTDIQPFQEWTKARENLTDSHVMIYPNAA